MSNTPLENVSYDLFMLLVALNKKIFNPHELMKSSLFPPSHGRVLFYLIHNGDSPISEIGGDLMISKPNMTPIIDKLEAEGFIKRFHDSKDRRIIRVNITPKTDIFFKQQQAVAMKALSDKISPLSEEDIARLSSSITDMKEIFSKLQI